MSHPEDMTRAPPPAEAVYISANEGGAKYYACDYIAALDAIEKRLEDFGIPIITPRPYGWVRALYQPANLSGICGAYYAWVMGCSPILLAGMTCFRGGTYHDDPDAESSGNRIDYSQHVKRWAQALDRMPGADVRALGGPLIEEGVVPAHDPTLPGRAPADPETLFAAIGGYVVQFVRPGSLPPFAWQGNDYAELNQNEKKRLRSARCIRVLGEIKNNARLRNLVPASPRPAIPDDAK